MAYPQQSAPPAPAGDAAKRRRVLTLVGGAVAVALALAIVGWLALGTGSATPAHTAAGGSTGPTATQPAATTAASPAGTTKGTPTGTAPSPAGPAAVRYRVGGDLCGAVDFAPLSGLAGQASGGPAGTHNDFLEFGYTDYSCLRRYAQGSGDVRAEIFGDAATAVTWYTFTRSSATGPASVAGLGTEAFDYLVAGSGAETYRLWVRDGNLGFGVTIEVKRAGLPSRDTLRAAAVKVARGAMPRLRG